MEEILNDKSFMKKVIIVHGYTSSPNKKKYKILSRELSNLGIDYSIPALPGGDFPHSREWLEIIGREVKDSKGPVVLVGHSLGTRAILLYLDKFEVKVDKVILIAALNNNEKENSRRRDKGYVDFFEYVIDINKIKERANKFVVIHLKDDDVVDCAQGVEIANVIWGRN